MTAQTATPKKRIVIEEINFEDISQAIPSMRYAIEGNIPTLLVGETGTGKTTLVREVAKSYKRELIRVNLNGSTSIEEIVGKWLLKDGRTYWINGALTDAMIKGQWIVFDEINAALPEVLFTLHSVLDDDRKLTIVEKDGEVIFPHNDFRFFATMNPCVNYAGTKEMNSALMSRFGVVLQIPHVSPDMEQKIIESRTGVEPRIAGSLTSCGIELRKAWHNEHIRFFCSTRDLMQAAVLHKAGSSFEQCVTVAIVNKGETPEERDEIRKKLEKIITLEAEGGGIEYADTTTLMKMVKKLKLENLKLNNRLDFEQKAGKLLEALLKKTMFERDLLYKLLEELLMPLLKKMKGKCDKEAKKAGEDKGEESKEVSKAQRAWEKLSQEVEKKMEEALAAKKKVDDSKKERGEMQQTWIKEKPDMIHKYEKIELEEKKKTEFEAVYGKKKKRESNDDMELTLES